MMHEWKKNNNKITFRAVEIDEKKKEKSSS